MCGGTTLTEKTAPLHGCSAQRALYTLTLDIVFMFMFRFTLSEELAMSHTASNRPPATPRFAPPTAEQAQIQDAFAALLPRTNQIADAISDHLVEVERTYYGHDQEVSADLRSSTRAHVQRGIERMAGRPSAKHESIDLWRATGRRRAQQGIPVAVVLTAYNFGTRKLWDALLQVGEELGVPASALLRAGQILWSDLDVQSQALRESHRREELVLQSGDPAQTAKVLDRLLRGHGSDPAFATEARRVLGLTADSTLMCLVWLPEEQLPSVAVARERLQNAGFQVAWRVHGEYAVGLVAASPNEQPRVRDIMARSVRGQVGTAACRDGLSGVVAAHNNALAAASSLARASTSVADITERLPEALIAGAPQLTSLLVEETIQPLLNLSGMTRQSLLETLIAALRHGGSATAAAEDLLCHRNTVVYRIKRIEQLTGRSLDDPRDRLLLSLAAIAIDDDLGLGPSPFARAR